MLVWSIEAKRKNSSAGSILEKVVCIPRVAAEFGCLSVKIYSSSRILIIVVIRLTFLLGISHLSVVCRGGGGVKEPFCYTQIVPSARGNCSVELKREKCDRHKEQTKLRKK